MLLTSKSVNFGFFSSQLIVRAFMTMTIFLRTEMHRETVIDCWIYMAALFFTIITTVVNSFSELALTIMRFPVFFKQRDLLFYPSWAYALPTWILKIPITVIEAGVWMLITYYGIGFDPNIGRWGARGNFFNKYSNIFGLLILMEVFIIAGRFFKQFLILLCVNQLSSGMLRFMAALGRNVIVANTFGSLAFLVIVVLGGYVITKGETFSFFWCCLLKCSYLVYNM